MSGTGSHEALDLVASSVRKVAGAEWAFSPSPGRPAAVDSSKWPPGEAERLVGLRRRGPRTTSVEAVRGAVQEARPHRRGSGRPARREGGRDRVARRRPASRCAAVRRAGDVDARRLRRSGRRRVSSSPRPGARRTLALSEDRDRIARDLHDLVIQRLFASGMQLESTVRLIDDEVAVTGSGRSSTTSTRRSARSARPSMRCRTRARPVATVCAPASWPSPTTPPRLWASRPR